MKKEFTMNTNDIQMLVIALIDSKCTTNGYLSDKPEVYEKLSNIFTEMNKLCWEGNDYTIKVRAIS